ncbi:MAG: hypothetical protein NC319_06445 [Butyricicoccus sp.]|nr:hypothetical protein [Butyricicoccus sp.]
MKLHENQLKLIRHLARFNLLDYDSCLDMLATPEMTDRVALSYAFRPLTKNGYLSKRKDGSVSILAKGRALFPELKPLISAGGGVQAVQRVIEVSRMAVLMERNWIPAVSQLPNTSEPGFIPSACWRNIAPGILSTTRFVGMLVAGGQRLAVYDIGDGTMEWQVRAEGSLFYTKYGSYETKATGMILICQNGKRDRVARNIIRQTMWNRRQLLSESCLERNRPTCWSRSPIKLRAQYEHVYLTTPQDFRPDLHRILLAEKQICRQRGAASELHDPAQGDYEQWPYRFFANPATDLLKYVYFFSAVQSLLELVQAGLPTPPQLRYAICFRPQDRPILQMYPDIFNRKEVKFYKYRLEEDTGND